MCLNPTYGLDKNLTLLLRFHKRVTYFLDGKQLPYSFRNTYEFFNIFPKDDFENLYTRLCYFDLHGLCRPCITSYACNKCRECISAKCNNLKSRLALEAASYDEQPIFFTLTFDDSSIPMSKDINGRSVQIPWTIDYAKKSISLFLKRLHTAISRCGLDSLNVGFRHFYISEFGPKTNRIHFHGFIFNHGVTFKTIKAYHDIFSSCWSKGFVYVSFTQSLSSFGYCTKYIFKNIFKKQDYICDYSTKGGSLGVPYFLKNNINPLKEEIVCSTVLGQYSCSVPRQIRNYLCPQFSRILPKFHIICNLLFGALSCEPSLIPKLNIVINFYKNIYGLDISLSDYSPCSISPYYRKILLGVLDHLLDLINNFNYNLYFSRFLNNSLSTESLDPPFHSHCKEYLFKDFSLSNDFL